MFIRLLGSETGSVSLKKVLEDKYLHLMQNDLTFEDIFKILVEEKQLVTLIEAKAIFNIVLENSAGGS